MHRAAHGIRALTQIVDALDPSIAQHSVMRFDGRLKSWDDGRGFGFIEPAQGGQEIFVHIKAFPSGTGRPSAGQALTFKVETAPNGKKRAHSVQYPVRSRGGKSHRPESPAPWTFPRLVAMPLFGAIVYVVATKWAVQPYALTFYLLASAVAFVGYGLDKVAARERRRRTPEATLHFLGLIGGWPGALVAQQLLRHKTSKPGFIAVFWLTVALNVAAFVLWHVASARPT